ALMARMMSLPAAPELAQAVDTVDPVAIVKARDWVAGHIAKEVRDLLIARLDRLPTDGAFSPSAEQAGRRALRRTLLTLLSATDTEAVIERAESLYERMQNMTDRITSLSAVNHLDDARREGLFARFYETWSHDPLVMDKWMGLQATSRRPGTFDRVKTLMRDPIFDLENPNRVRALLGMFAMHNLAAFHDASGAPYSFFMDRIVDIDRLNPMLSSRLLPAVSEWSRLEPARRALLKQALETLAHTENLSANLLEVLEKTRRTETIDA
ncbi:MAG: aminopeptidase N C-terminal domain-containing protein, partial [Pseudomonadota bacterium]